MARLPTMAPVRLSAGRRGTGQETHSELTRISLARGEPAECAARAGNEQCASSAKQLVMKSTPKLKQYILDVDQTTVTLSGFQHGSVAHFVAETDSQVGDLKVKEFYNAFKPIFFTSINKLCVIETWSEVLTVWAEGPKLCMGVSDLLEPRPPTSVSHGTGSSRAIQRYRQSQVRRAGGIRAR